MEAGVPLENLEAEMVRERAGGRDGWMDGWMDGARAGVCVCGCAVVFDTRLAMDSHLMTARRREEGGR